MDGHFYYGDNLAVMRRHIADNSVDLIYLDPPFKSDATYNMLLTRYCPARRSGCRSWRCRCESLLRWIGCG